MKEFDSLKTEKRTCIARACGLPDDDDLKFQTLETTILKDTRRPWVKLGLDMEYLQCIIEQLMDRHKVILAIQKYNQAVANIG